MNRQDIVDLFSSFDSDVLEYDDDENMQNDSMGDESTSTSNLSLPDSFLRLSKQPTGKMVAESYFESNTSSTVDAVKMLKKEVVRLRKILSERNSQFQDIEISMESYEELRRRPLDSLSLHELARFRSADYCLPLKQQLESTRLALEEKTRDYDAIQATSQTLEIELQTQKKLYIIADESNKLETSALDDRCKRLASQLESESKLRSLNEDKAFKYDQLEKDYTSYQDENINLKTMLSQQASILEALRQSDSNYRRSAEDHDTARRMLERDKAFLEGETRKLQAELDDRSRHLDHAKTKITTLDLKVSQLVDQISTIQLSSRSAFEENMDKEIRRVRETNARDIEQMKESMRDVTDKETRVLRDMLTSCQADNDQLKKKIDNAVQDNAALIRELAQQKAEKSNELSEVRAELKLKAFEVTTLGAKYEEKMQQLRSIELDLEVTRQELQAHKNALQRLESDSNHRDMKNRNEIETLQKRLSAYDTLEVDIDASVERLANGDIDQDNSGKLLFQLARNPERRIQQAVALAHRLIETQKQRDEAKQRLLDLQAQNQHLQQVAKQAEEDVARVAQPTSYLVIKLREEEAAKQAWMSKHRAVEETLLVTSQDRDACKLKSQHLSEKLVTLLKQREEIDALRELVEAWQHSRDDDDDEMHDDDHDHVARDHQPRVDESIRTSSWTDAEAEHKRVDDDDDFDDNAVSFTELGLTPGLVSRMLTPPSKRVI